MKKAAIIVVATVVVLALFAAFPMRSLYLKRLAVRKARTSAESHESFTSRMARVVVGMTVAEVARLAGTPALICTNPSGQEWAYTWARDTGLLSMDAEHDSCWFAISNGVVIHSSLNEPVPLGSGTLLW
jgi:hypothetical protein